MGASRARPMPASLGCFEDAFTCGVVWRMGQGRLGGNTRLALLV